jgi:glyoxylase-like metal-dependent hydrolase (beta-lactamase superfamily II)
MKIYSIEARRAKFDGGAVFGVVPKALWSKNYPADENNLCESAMRCMLIIEGDRKILIDTGMGEKQDEKFFKNFYVHSNFTLLSSLNKVGVSRSEITDVIVTHLHFDHIGGAVQYTENRSELELTFPNAIIHISKGQWELAHKPNPREAATFLPLNFQLIEKRGCYNLIENDQQFSPNIFLKFFHGHTDAQMIPVIQYHGKTIVYTSDMLPSAAHIPLVWVPSFDVRPLVSIQEKEQFLNDAIEKEYILFLEHDSYVECCTVSKTEKGFRLGKTFKLDEITGN